MLVGGCAWYGWAGRYTACHCSPMKVRGQLCSQLSLSTFKWNIGIKLRSPDSHGRFLYCRFSTPDFILFWPLSTYLLSALWEACVSFWSTILSPGRSVVPLPVLRANLVLLAWKSLCATEWAGCGYSVLGRCHRLCEVNQVSVVWRRTDSCVYCQ